MSDTKNYQCPNCNGPLHFDSETQKLKCDYCDSLYTVEEIENAVQESVSEDTWWHDEEVSDEFKVYRCQSCGAELVLNKNEAATSCPYCNNPVVLTENLTGTVKPDLVIPFKIDKKQAVQILHDFYKGKKLLPRAFKDENHINEIKGMYVPYWLFNGVCAGHVDFEATRSHITRLGNEEITTTEHFHLEREGAVDFTRVPVDASSKMPDEYMDAIEPYDYEKIVPFTSAYLAGYCADKYDEEVKDCAERADKRSLNTTMNIFRNSCDGFETVNAIHKNLVLKRKNVEYALLPVWILSTQYNGENFLFIINGQTGKLSGKLPMDNGLYWQEFAKTFGITLLGIAGLIAAITIL